MKNFRQLLLVICLLPLLANAMKIETDEVDEFTGNRTVITSWEGICGKYVHIRFRMQNGIQVLDFKLFYDNAIVIADDCKLMFKSTTDEIGTFLPIGIYSGTKGGGAVGISGSGSWGISAKYKGDLSYFANNTAKLMRIYATDFYLDKKLSESDGKKLQRLYELFSKTISGEQGTSAFMDCSVSFLKSVNGGYNWEEVKNEYYEAITKEELQTIMNAWKAQSSGSTIYECRVKKEK